MVRKAVRNNTLNLIRDKCHPDEKDDDNIDIYFLEEEKGNSLSSYCIIRYMNRKSAVLDIIPVKRNDYEMTQIYPAKPAEICKNAHTNLV